ncbi:hypothetical protein NKH18_37180 [Streptomyces sp. M10(2022)]
MSAARAGRCPRAGQQGERAGAQQLAVGAGGDAARGDRGVPGCGGPPGGPLLVMGPAVDGPAERGGLVLGQGGEQLVRARVAGLDEHLGQIVHGQITPGVQQRLRGGCHRGPGHRRTVLRGQRALVGEPAAEQRLHGLRTAREAPGDGVQIPLVPVGARCTVGGHETSQQIDPVLLRKPEPPPEPRPEFGVRTRPRRRVGAAGVIRPARTRSTPRYGLASGTRSRL